MRLPVIQGNIQRRLLVNFRVDPAVIQSVLPATFRPKLQAGKAIAGICLIRLTEIRPAGFPRFLGITSENAAHRIAVQWTEQGGEIREGVFIPRRDTSSLLNHVTGGRIFPGEHQLARFQVRDDGHSVDFKMTAQDRAASVELRGHTGADFPSTSCFSSLEAASAFFEPGALGYSPTRDPERLDGLRLETDFWRVQSFAVEQVQSSYFSDSQRFPKGTIEFDHALLMRNIPHRWKQAAELAIPSAPACAGGFSPCEG
jgi:hypothetical protein